MRLRKKNLVWLTMLGALVMIALLSGIATAPVAITLQFRFDLGPTRERQLLLQTLDRGRSLDGPLLASCEGERDRIDATMSNRPGGARPPAQAAKGQKTALAADR